mmetsp:Transcript_37436/g.67368  ORF Transcript_37436/g.67368 Transcript_37436/m.67368 type:complete len:90 (-) Transcript_37436:24-293(-)
MFGFVNGCTLMQKLGRVGLHQSERIFARKYAAAMGGEQCNICPMAAPEQEEPWRRSSSTLGTGNWADCVYGMLRRGRGHFRLGCSTIDQ